MHTIIHSNFTLLFIEQKVMCEREYEYGWMARCMVACPSHFTFLICSSIKKLDEMNVHL